MELEQNQTETSTTAQPQSDFDKLASSFFLESEATSMPVNEAKVAENNNAAPIDVTLKADPEKEEQADTTLPASDLKTNLGFDTWEDAKKQFEELKTLKETASTKEEIKFANEQSKKFYEAVLAGEEDKAYAILSEKKKIEKLISSEVNEKTAAEIIKLSFQQKYKGLSDELIDYKFNKQFGIPKEPVQKDTETEDEFEERHSTWKENVTDLKNDLLLEAQILKPELEKLKSELVLPDIEAKETASQQPSQEDIDKYLKDKESFIKSVDTVLKEFEGFNTSVKDEEVDIPLSYNLSDEEKKVVSSELKDFAEKGFNANTLFAERWVNKDGSLNVKQMANDWALLKTEGKVSQKFANDAFSKSKLKLIQERSNINVKGNSSNVTFNPQGGQTQLDELAKNFFADMN